MSSENMAGRDHRILGAPGTLALTCSLIGGAYLAPAAAFYVAPLRRILGIATTTLDGRGFGLTFDDGPHPQGTPAVLELLAARGVHATFFLVGEQVVRNPSLAAEIVAAGHGIGLHCDRHRNLLRLGPAAAADDIARARGRIEDATGCAIERYRPPYGIFTAAALAIAKRHGWRPLLWTHWGRDWEAQATAASITELLVGGDVAEGSVGLLHDADDYASPGSWRRTVAALPLVLDELERRGLEATLAL